MNAPKKKLEPINPKALCQDNADTTLTKPCHDPQADTSQIQATNQASVSTTQTETAPIPKPAVVPEPQETTTPALTEQINISQLVWTTHYTPARTPAPKDKTPIPLGITGHQGIWQDGHLHLIANDIIYPIIYHDEQFFLYFGDNACIPLDEPDFSELIKTTA